MMTLFKKQGSRSWLTKWYIGVFTIVVIGFTSVIYVHIKNQVWDKFNYGVSQLGEEMLEEISELRDDLDEVNFDASVLIKDSVFDLDVDKFAPIIWTPILLEKFGVGVVQEMIDESVDNHLEDVGFVQIKNLISGQQIYRSPEIHEFNIYFVEPQVKLWGYLPFDFKTKNGDSVKGIGYSGVRITKNYFVGLIPKSDEYNLDQITTQKFAHILYEITEALARHGDSLYVENQEALSDLVDRVNAWAYLYIHEEDRILWATEDINKSDIHIPHVKNESDIIVLPREIIPKEYFFDISDKMGRDYRQYSLVSDIIPTHLYKIDLAIPTDSIQKSLSLLAIYYSIGAILLIAIVWAGGNILMRRALQPVDDIIRSVNEITSTNLDKRLPIPKLENEIMRLVRTFNVLLNRLAKSFRMQKAFIADSSHELRTPLSIILSDIETALKNIENTSKIKDSLNNSVTEIERMARIVDDLHLLSRTESGQINVNREEIRLDDVLMSTVSRCQVLASKKEIILNLNKVEIIEYYGDEELLIRALSNLVYNAIKYSNEKAEVELNLYKKDAVACFSVSDDGIGISKENQSKIFDRFYRVDSSRSRETGGSGLGLAIVKWICEIHAGNIIVTSDLEKGSTFTIELPLEK
jgi:heavy metal sensor kinase